MEQIFLNGTFVDSDKALIPVGDRAVLYGDSVFETVRAYSGKIFRLERHLDRLFNACHVVRISPPMEKKEIARATFELLGKNKLDAQSDARIRITITGGPSSGPKGLERPGPPNLFITAESYKPPAEYYEKGISVILSSAKKDSGSPLSSMKTGNIMNLMIARQEAISRGADDAILLSTGGNLSEASSSNVFVVKDGKLLTPDTGCGLLPGITREAVIEVCVRTGIKCTAIMEGPEALSTADELFLTNSLVEILPVNKIGAKTLDPIPGPVTQKLMKAYKELVSSETRS